MSVRSIQQGFREELGMTPMTYVRERRLERVREELTDAIPADGGDGDAGGRTLGVQPPGSFAVEYRKRWGETPSERFAALTPPNGGAGRRRPLTPPAGSSP